MIIILDSNIIISALIKDSVSRKILFHPRFQFFIPEQFVKEINKHLKEISEKAGISVKEIEKLLNELKNCITILPKEMFREKTKDAEELIGSIDENDVPFIALALAIPNDGIWTNDKHFLKQKKIRIWKTEELIRLID